MTDPDGASRRSPGPLPVVTATLGSFLILLTILALQMRSGHDPALKPAVAARPPRTILERRIVRTRIIVTDAPPAPSAVATSSPDGSGSAVASEPPAAVRAAPPQAAPVAPPPPAPAPVTRTS